MVEGLTIVPESLDSPNALTLASIHTNHDEAIRTLRTAARGIHIANAANVFYRVILGKQLLIVQSAGLWRQDGASTWDEWIHTEFLRLTDFSGETGYAAMQLARCQTIASMDEKGLRSFRTIGNAIRLARIERKNNGQPLDRDVVEAAKTMAFQDFKLLAGHDDQGSVEVDTRTRDGAKHLTVILALLKNAEDGALKSLRSNVELTFAAAGGNATDLADAISAALISELGAQNANL